MSSFSIFNLIYVGRIYIGNLQNRDDQLSAGSDECLGCQCCVCWTGQIHCKWVSKEGQPTAEEEVHRWSMIDRWLGSRQAWDRHLLPPYFPSPHCSVVYGKWLIECSDDSKIMRSDSCVYTKSTWRFFWVMDLWLGVIWSPRNRQEITPQSYTRRVIVSVISPDVRRWAVAAGISWSVHFQTYYSLTAT